MWCYFPKHIKYHSSKSRHIGSLQFGQICSGPYQCLVGMTVLILVNPVGSHCNISADGSYAQCLCDQGQTDCTGQRVDTSSNINNCGACGNDCNNHAESNKSRSYFFVIVKSLVIIYVITLFSILRFSSK
jgi:hypothetical protein